MKRDEYRIARAKLSMQRKQRSWLNILRLQCYKVEIGREEKSRNLHVVNSWTGHYAPVNILILVECSWIFDCTVVVSSNSDTQIQSCKELYLPVTLKYT